MQVIKRDGTIVEFDLNKIVVAIQKANTSVEPEERASEEQIYEIARSVEMKHRQRILVEDIQDMVEQKLMELDKYALAKNYIIYRYNRALVRKQNTSNVYTLNHNLLNAYNYMKECVFIKEVQTGKVLFANEAMETLFGMDVTGMDSRSFLSEPTPTYTREGIQPVRDIKWQSYIQRVNKIMNINYLNPFSFK